MAAAAVVGVFGDKSNRLRRGERRVWSIFCVDYDGLAAIMVVV